MNKRQSIMKEKILKLTNFWYEYVSGDYHKDRDCHFYINEIWSYDNPPKYSVEHCGYIGRNIYANYNTYEEALKELFNYLIEIINEEKEWGKRVLSDPSNYDNKQIKQAEKIISFKY